LTTTARPHRFGERHSLHPRIRYHFPLAIDLQTSYRYLGDGAQHYQCDAVDDMITRESLSLNSIAPIFPANNTLAQGRVRGGAR